MKTSELVKILKKSKCQLSWNGANHDVWYSPITGKTFIVPRHPSQEIATGTANKILKIAGLK